MSKIDEILDKENIGKEKDTKKNYADKETKGKFDRIQICTPLARYAPQYINLRPLQYLEQHNIILCYADGYKFEIEGDNMPFLFEMMAAHAISRIKENEKIQIGEIIINVSSISAEALEQKE